MSRKKFVPTVPDSYKKSIRRGGCRLKVENRLAPTTTTAFHQDALALAQNDFDTTATARLRNFRFLHVPSPPFTQDTIYI